MDAYTQKKLRGKKLAAARRLIQQREARGPRIDPKPLRPKGRRQPPLTSDALVRAYQQEEASRQKLLIKKAELTQGRLMFVVEAFRALRDDDHFVTLLRAEGLDTCPPILQIALDAGGGMSRRKHPTRGAVAFGFESDCVTLPVNRSCLSVLIAKSIKSSRKYRQITASIREVGLVEPPVVAAARRRRWLLVAARWTCPDRSPEGSRHRTSRMPGVHRRRGLHLQQAHQPACAHPGTPDDPEEPIERGVSEEKIALALDLNPRSIQCARSSCSTASAKKPSAS
jgi:hypothetical protein